MLELLFRLPRLLVFYPVRSASMAVCWVPTIQHGLFCAQGPFSYSTCRLPFWLRFDLAGKGVSNLDFQRRSQFLIQLEMAGSDIRQLKASEMVQGK